jgi:hypothetical protein
MDLSSHRKIEIFEKVLSKLAEHFTLVNMSTYAKSVLERNNLKIIKPHA